MSVINTNITAMIGQQNLNQSQNALSTSMERLSSGLRINSAADDAAGQAIANRMTSQINGLGQAQSNANDGISVAQTAEGALNQVNDNLQRVRELTVQAQNGTNSDSDLSSIQDEINQRMDEIDRISKETDFNGVKVLAEDQEISIQVGANDGESISLNMKEINSDTLGLSTFSVRQAADVEVSDEITDFGVPSTDSISGEQTATSFSRDITLENANVTDPSGEGGTLEGFVEGDSGGKFAVYNDGSDNMTAYEVTADTIDDSGNIDLDSVSAEASLPQLSSTDVAAGDATDNVDASFDITPTTGGSITLPGSETVDSVVEDDSGNFYVKSDAGSFYEVDQSTIGNDGQFDLDASSPASVNIQDGNGDPVSGELREVMNEEGESTGTYVVQDGDNMYAVDSVDEDSGAVVVKEASYTDSDGNDQTTKVQFGGVDGETEFANVDGKNYALADDGSVDMENEIAIDASENPLASLDAALSDVDSMRSDLGAMQNRFDSAITNLSTTETNITSARSRIEDADYADEVSEMTRNQILQQAGTSVLSQANQLPQNALSLLG